MTPIHTRLREILTDFLERFGVGEPEYYITKDEPVITELLTEVANYLLAELPEEIDGSLEAFKKYGVNDDEPWAKGFNNCLIKVTELLEGLKN